MRVVVYCLLLCTGCTTATLPRDLGSAYEPRAGLPFGAPNPEAPPELSQFHFIVGENDCIEERRQGSSEDWSRDRRSWDAHYTMNGYAILDSGRSSTASNGNMRVFDPATKQWHVTFFSMPVYGSGVWKGERSGNQIVLSQPQKAPGTDMDGMSRLTFSKLTDQGFDWVGEWVSEDGRFVFPFWKISCQKVRAP